MAESQYSYGTSILTSKTPQQAAAILPSSIECTQNLLEKNLLGWFNRYTQLLQQHNLALNQLLQDGSKVFQQQNKGEYEGFHKVWNCLMSSIQVEIHSNEALFKNLKLEAIGPLKDVFQKDVRYSELLVNSQELQEISRDLAHNNSNAEMQWNMKAPQIFDNFENFKKFETQLLFDVSYSLLNGLNSKYTKSLSNNENSVNYVLNGYKIDEEMASYLQYLLHRKDIPTSSLASSSPAAAVGTASSKGPNRQSRQVSHSDLNSVNSSATSGSALKKSSKLKSKMGSIFGRKGKAKRGSGIGAGTIPETESVTSSIHTNSRLNKSTDSIDNLAQNNVKRSTSVRDSRRPSTQQNTSQSNQAEEYQQQLNSQKKISQQDDPLVQNKQILQQGQHPQISTLNAAPLTPRPINGNPPPIDSPNVVKYDSETSDEELEDPNNKGNRMSMLQRHSLGGPENGSPIVERFPNGSEGHEVQNSNTLSTANYGNERNTGRLSQSSVGKYSFEAGDEDTPISSAHIQQDDIFEDKAGEANLNDNAGINNHQISRNAGIAGGIGLTGVAAAAAGHIYSKQEGQSQAPDEYKDQYNGQYQQQPDLHESQYLEQEQQETTQGQPQEQYQRTQQRQGQPQQQVQTDLSQQWEKPQDESRQVPLEIPGAHVSSQQLQGQQSPELSQQKGSGLPPPPPKSRKVIHRESSLKNHNYPSSQKNIPSLVSAPSSSTESKTNRRDVNSQMFHNLPSARDSIQQPMLISQDTGNSLLRNSDYFKHFNSDNYVESNGLNSSVAEVINVSFKNDQLIKSQIIGEIAFNYKKQLNEQVEPIAIRIPSRLDKVILNNSFIERLNDHDFNINPESVIAKTLGGIKYLKNLTLDEVPILILQIWKFESHQSSLMVSLKLNPKYADRLVLNNLVISVALDSSCETLNASSRPQGSFNKEKNRITWRYNNSLQLTSTNLEEKLIARFSTNGIGSEHESGIQVKFAIQDAPHQPYVLNYRNEPIPCVRNLITGSYSGHS